MTKNLELDFIRDEILLDLGRSLVSLDKLLIVCSHDLESHNLFAERAELRLLLLLLGAQVLDVLDTLLQHGGLAHLVTRGVRLLAVRHKLLQEKPVID